MRQDRTGQTQVSVGLAVGGKGSKLCRSCSGQGLFFFGLPASTHGGGKMACAVRQLRVCLPTWQHHRRERGGRDKRDRRARRLGVRTCMCGRAAALKMPMLAWPKRRKGCCSFVFCARATGLCAAYMWPKSRIPIPLGSDQACCNASEHRR